MFTPKADVAFPPSMKVTYRQMVPMRDGIDLSTHVYLPDAKGGPFPTLLVRDIYGNGPQPGRQRYAKFATQNGYAFVYQVARAARIVTRSPGSLSLACRTYIASEA